MVECHVRFIYKPNAFLMISDAILQEWHKIIRIPQVL